MKCYNDMASCMNDTWYKLWTRFKVRGLDGYAVSNAVGRRKKGNGKLVCHGFEYNRFTHH